MRDGSTYLIAQFLALPTTVFQTAALIKSSRKTVQFRDDQCEVRAQSSATARIQQTPIWAADGGGSKG